MRRFVGMISIVLWAVTLPAVNAAASTFDGQAFGAGVAQASASPDGKQIAYQKSTPAGWRIYVANVDGSNAHAVTSGPHDDVEPAWRPDGKVIAFSSNRGGHFNIYTIDPNGVNVRLLVSSNQDDRYPQWSPRQYALPYEKDPLAKSYRTRTGVAPSDLKMLESLAKNSSDWALYGERFTSTVEARYYKLLYVTGASDKRRIATIREDGRQRQIIDFGLAGAEINPCWSTDASSFGFVLRGAADSRVYTADYPTTHDLNDGGGDIKFGIDVAAAKKSLTQVGPTLPRVPQIGWTIGGDFLAVAVDDTMILYSQGEVKRPPVAQSCGPVAPYGFSWMADGRTAVITAKSGGQNVLQPVSFSFPLVDIGNLTSYDDPHEPDNALGSDKLRYVGQNGFVAGGASAKQMFQIYEDTDYRNLPIFITSDSLLHLNHLTFDYLLRSVEADHLMPATIALIHHYLSASITQASTATDPAVARAARRNAAFFAVAAELAMGKVHTGEVKPVADDNSGPLSADLAAWKNRKLHLDKQHLATYNAPLTADLAKLPADVKPLVATEIVAVAGHAAPSASALFNDDPDAAAPPYDIDYTDFVPRGHYTKSEMLRRYFLVSHWLAGGPYRRSPNLTRRALLIVAASDDATVASWRKIEQTVQQFVGGADDQNIVDYARLAAGVYGHPPTTTDLANESKLTAFVDAVDKLPPPRIAPSSGASFRFLPAPYTADAEIMQNLIHDRVPPDVGTDDHPRPFALGLDVMAVLGSDRAHDILGQYAFMQPYTGDTTVQTAYENYGTQFDRLRQQFADWTEDDWSQNLYTRNLYAMQPLLTLPAGGSTDAYTQNEAWTDKELAASLGAWAELKHDTMPKQATAIEMGGEGGISEAPVVLQPVGYVEPQPQVYRRLAAVVDAERNILKSDGYLTTAFAQRLDTFSALLSMVLAIEAKQQRGEPLNEREVEQLRFYGGYQEHLTLITTEGGETGSLEGNDMAIVADVSSVVDKRSGRFYVLEEGVGHAVPIYVAVPRNGHREIAAGAVFSYYEFPRESDRLTDEAWRAMLGGKTSPSMPSWTSSYMSGIADPRDGGD